jgi:hypothetical protein
MSSGCRAKASPSCWSGAHIRDIAAGRGCGFIDPHSLLVDDLLWLLITEGVLANPDIRQRLIYVDPACTDYVVPFNVLAS